ncbi:MAG: ABC transporter ATP-binding protein/permease [Firmicutes bacterium]|nr:ABC transporter ATP-binding protein/permease [Bacillota bacterium]
MVRLDHVHKYFFRRRRNEIHAINDTSLETEDRGLVALLGPSGCGKTTLLNAIGGLDKVNKGAIYVNGQRISRRMSGTVDRIRTLSIGYIFQNYNLVENMTVFDNVAIALRMIGIKNKAEIKEKVNYVLEKVGMYRYRNRYADMLSGGERQRVGIARALVKNPTIVIADEPTGNLDSKNTLEVMNIIKAISREKLVILVTHEEKLAEFYADRIIRIKDGKIESDEINTHNEGLDYRIDNKIYLKDIQDHKRVKTDKYNVDFYSEGGRVDLNIVVRGGNIYIQAKNDMDSIEVVDDHSAVELIDDHYRKMAHGEEEDSFSTKVLDTLSKRKYTSILNPVTLMKRGFKTVSNYPTLKKVLLLGFCISAGFITYAICMTFGTLHITDSQFTTEDKDYLTLVGKNISVDTYVDYQSDGTLEYVMPGDSKISLPLAMDQYYQTKDAMVSLNGSLSSKDRVTRQDIIAGRLPQNDHEIVVDRMVVKSTIEDQYTKELGLGTTKSFLGQRAKIPHMGEFTIVGITNKETPCIYTDPAVFINLIANAVGEGVDDADIEVMEAVTDDSSAVGGSLIDYELMKSEVTLKKGEWPKDKYQVLVNDKNKDDPAYKIGRQVSTKINDKKLTITGYYSDPKDSDYLLVNETMIKYKLIKDKKNMTLCPKDKSATLRTLKENGVNVRDVYTQNKNKYLQEKRSSMLSILVLAGVILGISFIEIFLMIRASFLSRIKEVGVYRAIGVKKRDIYKMFSGEILAISILASLPGFLFMAFIISRLIHVSYLRDMFLINSGVLLICLIVIFGLNIVFGLMPVWRTIRKTPAEILARTDVN